MESEWAPRPSEGRVFESSRPVRLSDAGPRARLRLDGVARYLQDVATDDSDDARYETGPGTDDVWVVRWAHMRLAAGGSWPRLGERVRLATWCGGLGRAWAIRRTDISGADSAPLVETSSLWVHLDGRGRPARLSEAFVARYRQAAGGRSASAALAVPAVDPAAVGTRWPIRVADLDVLGHVNNAAVWAALVEVASAGDVEWARVAHHGPLEGDDEVWLRVVRSDGGVRAWLTVGDSVRASAAAGFR